MRRDLTQSLWSCSTTRIFWVFAYSGIKSSQGHVGEHALLDRAKEAIDFLGRQRAGEVGLVDDDLELYRARSAAP